MKITDFTILLLIVLWVFVSMDMVKEQSGFERRVQIEEINRIMDNVVVSALQQGYTGDRHLTAEKTVPVLEEQKLADTFISEMAFMLYGADNEANRQSVWAKVPCIVVIRGEEYLLYRGSVKGEWIVFSSEKHEQRVREIEKVMGDCLQDGRSALSFPAGDSEPYSQTLSGYAVLAVYEMTTFDTMGHQGRTYILSGAAVK